MIWILCKARFYWEDSKFDLYNLGHFIAGKNQDVIGFFLKSQLVLSLECFKLYSTVISFQAFWMIQGGQVGDFKTIKWEIIYNLFQLKKKKKNHDFRIS